MSSTATPADAALHQAMRPGQPQPRFQSYSLFGAKITPTTLEEVLRIIQEHALSRQPCVMLSQNMHGLRIREQTPAFGQLEALESTYVHIDGMALVALCRIAGIPAERRHRVTWVDLIWEVLRGAEESGLRVYILAGTEETLPMGLEKITARHPTLELAGHRGWFDVTHGSPSASAILNGILEFNPHLLLVGLGMPTQERWVANHLSSLPPMCVCVMGACLEYVAGAVSTPPRWIGRWGLEWLYRLLENPQRFWKRYLIEPWFVLAHAIKYSYRTWRRGRAV